APACRMRWGCHHLFRSYDRNLSNIANIRLHSVSGHTIRLQRYIFLRRYAIPKNNDNEDAITAIALRVWLACLRQELIKRSF
ncbi:hypothetical protein V7U47_14145, partial [Segatella copri]|uniref:hypothetical protein n=2 Tax=Segatella copri TaxID=165179 RepID=UPI002FF33041